MMQVIEQTHEETVAMYMKCSKKELAEMLATCNEALRSRPMTYFHYQPAFELTSSLYRLANRLDNTIHLDL